MAAATIYSSLYDTNGLPTNGRPFNPPIGGTFDYVLKEIPTTSQDDAGDRIYMIPVPSGRTVVALARRNEAQDTGTAIDMDIVGVTADKDGVLTETILVNEGTAFEAARTAYLWETPNWKVPASATGYGHVALKINVAATTPVAGDVELLIFVR